MGAVGGCFADAGVGCRDEYGRDDGGPVVAWGDDGGGARAVRRYMADELRAARAACRWRSG